MRTVIKGLLALAIVYASFRLGQSFSGDELSTLKKDNQHLKDSLRHLCPNPKPAQQTPKSAPRTPLSVP
jgi:hypothetical protein